MTQDEIIRVAQEAGFVIWSDTSRKGMVDWACEYDTELERFAALVAAHEREKAKAVFEELEREVKTELINAINGAVELEREVCAKVCDDYADKCVESENWEAEDVSLHCDAAIRARGNK